MLKKSLSLALAVLMLQLVVAVQTVSATPAADKQSKFAQKVKEGISKLGVGKDARVAIKLRDKTVLSGYISDAKEDSFVISNAETDSPTTVEYANVTRVKGHNLSTGAKIAIGIGIGVGIMLIILAIYLNCCTG